MHIFLRMQLYNYEHPVMKLRVLEQNRVINFGRKKKGSEYHENFINLRFMEKFNLYKRYCITLNIALRNIVH